MWKSKNDFLLKKDFTRSYENLTKVDSFIFSTNNSILLIVKGKGCGQLGESVPDIINDFLTSYKF